MASILNATTSTGFTVSPDNSGSLQLATNNGTTAVTIDTSQNVGIGTSSPAVKLDVTGTVVASGLNARITNTDTDASARAAMQYKTGASSNVWQTFAVNGALVTGIAGVADYMRIDSSGNAYIGKTSASSSTAGYEFNVGGSAYSVMTNTRTDGLGDLFILNRQGSNGTLVNFFTANSSRGTISYNGSVIVYGGSSDYRLKENIQPMTGALAKIAQLKPVTYTWKSNGKNGEGFIAHELQEVVPDCVAGEKDAVDAEGNPQYQNVDPRFLVATLTAAIQELKAELDATKAEVQALKGVA